MADRKVTVLEGADGNDYDVMDDAAQQKIGTTALPTTAQTLTGAIAELHTNKVPNTRKVNNKALSADVTLTGSDIPVSSSDSTKIDTAFSDLKSALNEISDATTIPTANMFNKQKAVSGEINSNGTLYYGDQTNYALSEYIDVSDLNAVSFIRGNSVPASCYYNLYDGDKQLIGARNAGSSADTSNAAYIIVNPQKTWLDTFMVCASDNIPTSYVPYGIEFKYIDKINEIGTVPSGKTVQGQINTIDGKIGSTAIPTTAPTLSGAIAEHENDITALGRELNEVENATVTQTANLFNKGTSLHGEINANGTLYYGESTVYELSDYIDVSKIDSVGFYRDVSGSIMSATCYAVLFDSSKQLIGGRLTASSVDVSEASYIIVNPQQAWHDTFMVCASNNVPTSYVSYGKEFKYMDAINSIKTVDYVGQGRKYTSILKALKESEANTIIVESGTYNVVNEYKAEYGNSFWDNYEGYSGSDDDFMKGLWVKNREVILSPNAKVVFDYSGNNTNVGSYFSIFAVSKNATIRGGYLQAVNLPNESNAMLRYFIHDDFENWLEGSNEYDSIVFDGSVRSSAVIGGGCGIHNLYKISNCVFLNNSRPYDISYHNNASDGVNFIDVHGCYGNSVCAFRWYGDGTSITHCIAHDNHFSTIECVAHTTEPHENVNMVLHAWNNVTSN